MRILGTMGLALTTLVGSVALSPPMARAGWEIEERDVTNWEGNPVRGQSGTWILVQANRYKKVWIAESGRPHAAVIYDLVADQYTRVDYEKRRYASGSFQEWERAEQAELARRQAGVSEKARKEAAERFEKFLEKLGEESAGIHQEVRPSGERQRIAGYDAVRYDVVLQGTPFSHVWVAKDLPVWREVDLCKLERVARRVVDAPSWLSECGASEPPGPAQALSKIASEGYVMRHTMARDVGRTDVVRVQERALPDSEFRPPPGFVRRPIGFGLDDP